MSDSGGGSPHPDDDATVADGADEPASSPADRTPPAEQSGGAVRSPDRRPPSPHDRNDGAPEPAEHPIRWYFETERPLVVASRDVLSSVLLVTMVGLALFAVSGVWPPLVAVESGSMEQNMHQGDLVLVVEDERFASQLADEHGIVTQRDAVEQNADHRQFGEPGSVIVYRPDGETGTPIIHRVAFAVEAGDNWVATADPTYLGNVDQCSDIANCPANYDGYITRGDANAQYDQVAGQSDVVKPGWIRGRAVSRVPYLGCVRLALSEGGICGA